MRSSLDKLKTRQLQCQALARSACLQHTVQAVVDVQPGQASVDQSQLMHRLRWCPYFLRDLLGSLLLLGSLDLRRRSPVMFSIKRSPGAQAQVSCRSSQAHSYWPHIVRCHADKVVCSH